MSALMEAALFYASKGWTLIPLCWPDELGLCGCGRGHSPGDAGKAPLVREWQKIQRTPENQIREWWTRWPQANIGLLLSPSGLLAVDADSEAAVQELESLGAPPAPRVRSHRGYHLLYERGAAPTARAVHRGESGDIDVLSAGYVILPPSRHRLGTTYHWLQESLDVGTPPGWAVDWLREAEVTSQAEVTLAEVLPQVRLADLRVSDFCRRLIVQGLPAAAGRYSSRSEAAFAVMRLLRQAGHTAEEIAAVMLNDEWAIGDKYREKHYPLDAVRRELARLESKTEAEGDGGSTPVVQVGDDQDVLLDREGVAARMAGERDMEWLVEGLLPVGMMCVFGAYSKTGKTTMALHLAKAILQGGEFLGHKAVKAPVIYANYEMHLATYSKMCSQIIGEDKEWPWLVYRPTVPTSHELLCSYVQKLGGERGLLIVDPARGAFRLEGEEENWSGTMGRKVREVLQVARDTGWAVLLIHHSSRRYFVGNISIADLAGSSDVAAAADVIWIWRAGNDEDEPGKLLMDGRVHQRTIYDVMLSRETCHVVQDGDGVSPGYKVLEAIADGGIEGVTRVDIEQVTGLPGRTVRYYVKQFTEREMVEVLGNPKSPGVRYRLANSVQPQDFE